ncbi:MAG: hypothetical protein LBU97_00050 [Alistipes sp.]|nr:hypothetical protein [Alistipes sp.]
MKYQRLRGIRSARQLREARREMEIRQWVACELLTADARRLLSLRGLISMILPEGSIAEKVVDAARPIVAAIRDRR